MLLPSYGQAALVLKGDDYKKIPIGHHLHILEDRTGELQLDSILEHPDSYLFNTFDSEVPSFGYTKSTYWEKLVIDNESSKDYRWVLELAYAPLDSVTVYIETKDGFSKKIAGASECHGNIWWYILNSFFTFENFITGFKQNRYGYSEHNGR